MTQEVFIDGIGNISVQGPVVTLTFTREAQGGGDGEKNAEEVLHLTMTGQNLLKITNILNNTIKRLAQRAQDPNSSEGQSSETAKVEQKIKKDKTVN